MPAMVKKERKRIVYLQAMCTPLTHGQTMSVITLMLFCQLMTSLTSLLSSIDLCVEELEQQTQVKYLGVVLDSN